MAFFFDLNSPASSDPTEVDMEVHRVFEIFPDYGHCYNLYPSPNTLPDGVDEHGGDVGITTGQLLPQYKSSATPTGWSATMNRVTLDEILGLERYEQVRDDFRRQIIAMKKDRRVAVGDRVTFVFENHDTMLFQIQEMVRTEHITDLDKIRDELEVYNALVPDGHELSTTMLIEITDSDHIREELVQLIGIDEAVRLEIGDPAHGGCSAAGSSKPAAAKRIS